MKTHAWFSSNPVRLGLSLLMAWDALSMLVLVDWQLGKTLWLHWRLETMAAVFCFWWVVIELRAAPGLRMRRLSLAACLFLTPPVAACWVLSLIATSGDGAQGWSVFVNSSTELWLMTVLAGAVPIALTSGSWRPTLTMVSLACAACVPVFGISIARDLVASQSWPYAAPGLHVVVHVTAWSLCAVAAAFLDRSLINAR
ncbi:MAG: hypothetical protein V4650_01370 [Pseudomonadota bacterium]